MPVPVRFGRNCLTAFWEITQVPSAAWLKFAGSIAPNAGPSSSSPRLFLRSLPGNIRKSSTAQKAWMVDSGRAIQLTTGRMRIIIFGTVT